MKNIGPKLVFALLMSGLTIWSFLVPDAPLFQRPELARIFFWHFPCPMLLTAFMALGTYFSLRQFLRISKSGLSAETDLMARREWDARAEATLELGFIFAILTMVTGITFSLAQWGSLWQWDPRQTSFLFALLIYAAYFALRGAFSDFDKRASNAAAYMMAAILPLIFLIYVFPRLPQVQEASFHPTESIMKGNIKGQYAYVVIALLTFFSVLSAWLYRLRVSASLLEIQLDYGNMETSRRSSAAPRVVRPVRVPHEGGEEA